MLRRAIWPLLFGVGGVAILLSLGVWQVQRLAWKTDVLADIETRITAAPVSLPARPDPIADRYLPVEVSGQIEEAYLRILVSQRGIGAGYRVISVLETDGRRVLVDRGVMPTEATPPQGHENITVTGNLHWPVEIDGFTPEPDALRNIWYARDVPRMASALSAEPILIIARETTPSDGPVTPLPVDTSDIPNDHLNYAITWFSLAALWLGMTAYLLWRIRRRTV